MTKYGNGPRTAEQCELDFYARIDFRGPDECWPFRPALKRNDYGRIRYLGRNWQAQRLMWFLKNGPIPEGMLVCHTCDFPPCTNPKHLFIGTVLDNAIDREKKGRNPKLFGGGKSKFYRNPLTDYQVSEMRRMHASGVSIIEISEKFSRHKSHVTRLVNGSIWTHLENFPSLIPKRKVVGVKFIPRESSSPSHAMGSYQHKLECGHVFTGRAYRGIKKFKYCQKCFDLNVANWNLIHPDKPITPSSATTPHSESLAPASHCSSSTAPL